MRGINKVILVGTLGRDPETKTFPNGGSITTFSIATSDVWTDKNTGERREQTEWHRITLNNRLGDVAQQYLRKGSKVYIEGSLHTRQWKDPETGQDRFSTEIRGNQMQMLDSRQNNGDYYQGGNAGYNQGGFGGNNQGYNQGGYNNSAYNQGGFNQGQYGQNSGFNAQGGFSNPQAGFQNPNAGFNSPSQPSFTQSATPSNSAPVAPVKTSTGDEQAKTELDDDLPF